MWVSQATRRLGPDNRNVIRFELTVNSELPGLAMGNIYVPVLGDIFFFLSQIFLC